MARLMDVSFGMLEAVELHLFRIAFGMMLLQFLAIHTCLCKGNFHGKMKLSHSKVYGF